MPVAPLPVGGEPSRIAVLVALRDVAAQAAAIDVVAADDDHGAIAPAATELCELLEHTLELLAALQLVDDDDTAIADLDRLEQRLELRAAIWLPDVCAAATTELRRALRELLAAVGDDDRVIAIDNGRRKLRRAAGAVLDAAREHGGRDLLGGEPRGRHQLAELASGLAVRQLYAQFRRALRGASEVGARAGLDAVLAAVRHAGNALAALVADRGYSEVRARDRRALRKLRERALLWLRHDRSVAVGLQLLDDIHACGEALRAINRRQLVAVHDSALVSVLGRTTSTPPAAWFTQLDALFGLDDALDAVLDRARMITDGDHALAPLVPLARAALARLAHGVSARGKI